MSNIIEKFEDREDKKRRGIEWCQDVVWKYMKFDMNELYIKLLNEYIKNLYFNSI